MPRKSRRRARRLNVQTRFSLAEHEGLEAMLAAQPIVVLRRFAAAHIGSLSELEAYHRIKRDNPERAEVIEFVAFAMGIPINPELDDVLSGPRGEV